MVRNTGELTATDVKVRFEIKEFSASGDDSEYFDAWESQLVDVPPTQGGNRFEITADWPGDEVPSSGHYCIRATLVAGAQDSDPSNNIAHSNFSGDFSSAASPASRGVATVQVRNPYSEKVTYDLQVNQTHEDFRAFLEHRWVKVPAGQTKDVEFGYEYSEDFPAKYDETPEAIDPFNLVSVQSQHIPPDVADDNRSAQPWKRGVQMRVMAGFKTAIETGSFDESSQYIESAVTRVHDGTPVDGGEVLITVSRSDGTTDTYRADVIDGEVAVPVDLTEWVEVDVQYLGLYPHNPTGIQTFTP